MQSVVSLVEQYGLLIVFLNAVVHQGGLPLPIIPTLLMTAALVSHSLSSLIELVLAAAVGMLIADFLQYLCGRQYGQRFLGLLCKISFSPDFCVRRTQDVFARLGPWSLLLAKFIPGLSLISVAMAGVTRMSSITFLLLDFLGALLFVSLVVWLGAIFHDAIGSLLATLQDYGKFGALFVVAAIGFYIFIKWLQRRLFVRRLRMDRITVAELSDLIDAKKDLLILDVRPLNIRVHDGIIPGAVAAHPTDIDPIVMDYPHDMECIVYCACPNEESAATAARHLRRAGFKKIRPLLGGIEAWTQAGHEVVSS